MALLSPRLRYLLFPVALFYWAMIFWRNLFYTVGFFVSRRLPIPVISVGNLSVGGTGKTPAVIYLAGRLSERGYRVAVVSRGYRREGSGTVVVSDSEKMRASPTRAGDEPYLTAKRLPGVPVIVDEVRYRGCTAAVERFKPDVIILDDAFQHRALERDVDLVLLNSKDPPEDYKLLPYGKLREPWIHLRRADMIFWTKTNLVSDDGRRGPHPFLQERASAWGVPTHTSFTQPDRLVRAETDETVPLTSIRDKRVFAFCGIADPDSFRQVLQQCGCRLVGFRSFDDHHAYSRSDVEDLAAGGKSMGADLVVTTEKDLYKIRPWVSNDIPFFSLGIRFAPSEEGERALWSLIEKSLPRA